MISVDWLVAINPCSISIKGNDSNSIIVSSNPLSQSVYYCPVNGRFLCEARLVNLPSFSSFTFQNRTLENSGNRLFYWPDVPTHGVKALKKTQGNYRYPKLAWTHPFFIHHWTSGKRVTAPLTPALWYQHQFKHDIPNNPHTWMITPDGFYSTYHGYAHQIITVLYKSYHKQQK